MSSSYRILVQYDAGRRVYLARVPEIDGCVGEGATRAEAIAKAEEELTATVENMRAAGGQPPAALDDEPAQPGEEEAALTVPLSRSLLRELRFQAKLDQVEVRQLAAEILAAGLEYRRTRGRRPSPGPQQPRGDQQPGPPRDRPFDARRGSSTDPRYHSIMEDRGSFMEYVRGLEQGQRGPGQRPSGPPRRGGGGGGGPKR